MIFSAVSSLAKRKSKELLVIPFYQDKSPLPAFDIGSLKNDIKAALESGDFKGKESEVLIVYTNSSEDKRVALLGLGKQNEATAETIRRCYGALVKSASNLKVTQVNVVVPKKFNDEKIFALAEGMLLANYNFEELRSKDSNHPSSLIKKCDLIGIKAAQLKPVNRAVLIAEGVYLARDLINGNADDVTPQKLADLARSMAGKHSTLKAAVLDKKRIEKENMGLLLAVNRGSARDPALIILEYKGNARSKEKTVLVGKGITYDTGGLNLKPTGSMETMKSDMSGAAVVLGIMQALANLGLKKNVTMVIPSTENSIGSNSYKPGDIYTSYLGKTVEIGNTDAEGRLVLADALAYAVKKLNPTRIIDFATLTGAMVIALGEETTGMMSNHDALAKSLIKSGENTFERVWRLPLFEEYKKALKSDFADIKNVGGRAAGSITAAMFLKEFVGDIPWAHFDIAGTAFLSKAHYYQPKNGTGIGVRLILDFLEKN